MKTVKRIVLTIWVILALLVFAGGLFIFLQDISLEGYVEWGGMCAFVCIIHLVIDFCSKDRSYGVVGLIVYIVLSILLGPGLLILFVVVTGAKILSLSVGKKKKSSSNSGNRNKSGSSEQPSDSRSADFHVFNDAMERAISKVVSNSSHYPDGRYVRVARRDVQAVTTKAFGIKIYGSVTYEANHYGPERSPEEYREDIVDCITKAQQNLLDAAMDAAESVQQRYQGFDNDWEIKVQLKPEVR